jgi:hypothetical protein
MAQGWQTQVYNQEAQGVAGDRASQNAIMTFDAGPGGLVADLGGIVVGQFAWTSPPTDPNATNMLATQVNGVSGAPAGFVYNATQALNTVFLSDAGLVIPQGLPVGLATRGDFWAINNGASVAQPGQKAYAQFGTGAVSFAATGGTNATVSTATGSVINPATGISVTGSIYNDILTVTAVGAGTIVKGAAISGSGITGSPLIASQLTQAGGDAPGLRGTYALTVDQRKSIASETISGTYGVLTVGTMTLGQVFSVGQVLSGGTTSGGTTITQLLTGSGGAGSTFAVNPSQTVASATINGAGGVGGTGTAGGVVETNWFALSGGVQGGLVKMGTWT